MRSVRMKMILYFKERYDSQYTRAYGPINGRTFGKEQLVATSASGQHVFILFFFRYRPDNIAFISDCTIQFDRNLEIRFSVVYPRGCGAFGFSTF